MRHRDWSAGTIAAGIVTLAALALAARPVGQAPVGTPADELRTSYDTYRAMAQASPYAATPWQYLGPTNFSGRATDVAVVDRGGSRRIYTGYATSGVWQSDDNGLTWKSIFDNEASTSIGDLAVSPSDPDVVWVGTGESNIFRASMPGVGVYKSADGGRTFVHMGLADTQTIGRIVVHPTNADTVYVAASGHEWTDNETRGVFKTIDGGRTWTRVFYRSPRTGAIDLVIDPGSPDTLYVSMWQRVRRKWSDPRVEPGYDEGGIWKTTDGGATWSDASAGLPAPRFRGRIGLDISRSNPNVLYALVDNYDQGAAPRVGERDAYQRLILESRIKAAEIYRSEDRGATWRKVSESNPFMSRVSGTYGWVFGQIRVDPRDDKTIYLLGIGLHVSHDSGKTFKTLEGTHGDHHGLWIDPANPAILYDANDGGFYMSANAGAAWTFAVSAGGSQFYNVTLDAGAPAWAYGSIQDIGSRRGRIDLAGGRDRIPAAEWTPAPGGEGSHHAIDPQNSNIVYSHTFYGNFTRDDLGVPAAGRGSAAAAPGAPRRSTPIRPGGEGLRAQWMAPIVMSPHNPATIYAGFQYVFRSIDRGGTWEKISGDLSDNDPARMLPRSSSEIPYQTVVALAESPRKPGLAYAGTDDGRFHVTVDSGKTWTDLTGVLRPRKWISRIVPSQHAEATVYVTERGREDDDFAAYVYRSDDFGATARSLTANLPRGSVNVIREDPADPSMLYLGTDFGAFVSVDGGRRWEVLGRGLPSVQVSDLQYHARDHLIVISTYGRGMWALDATRLRAGG